jgi:aryl-alcohol dehydrogenase-like predicted oxidoreductase
MQTRRVGASGLQVSEIGLGSWLTLGSKFDEPGAARLVQSAFDKGINFFDTADVYADGEAERSLGRALRDIPRHHVVVASKCFFAMSDRPNDAGLSRKHVVESVEQSLARLGTDYLDLHQCHRPDPDVPIEETVRAYEDLVRQGKILYWGVSKWERGQIEAACEVADRVHGYRPISNQPEYSLLARDVEGELLGWCCQQGVGQIVFSPLGQGDLSGKYRDGARPTGSRANDAERNQWMSRYLEPDSLARVERLRPIAEELSLSLSQLALAWCLRSRAVASVIVGATSEAQLEENCSASGLTLPAPALEQIDEIFPR